MDPYKLYALGLFISSLSSALSLFGAVTAENALEYAQLTWKIHAVFSFLFLAAILW